MLILCLKVYKILVNVYEAEKVRQR